MPHLLKCFVILGSSFVFNACNAPEKSLAKENKLKDSIQENIVDSTKKALKITYKTLLLNDSVREKIKTTFAAEELFVISSLNRIDY